MIKRIAGRDYSALGGCDQTEIEVYCNAMVETHRIWTRDDPLRGRVCVDCDAVFDEWDQEAAAI